MVVTMFSVMMRPEEAEAGTVELPEEQQIQLVEAALLIMMG